MKKNRIFHILFSIALLLAMVAAVVPSTASAETIKDCKQWHTVQRGEYLSLIAKNYGVDWRYIAEVNSLNSPYVIYPGQKICVSTSSTVPYTPPSNISGIKVYAASVREDKTVILKGRDLVPSSWYSIYLSNEKVTNATRIYVGTVLTDKDGGFQKTFNIPKKLIDVSRVKVNIYNTKGDSAHNWFLNANLDGNTGGIGMPALSAVIESSKIDKWVKVKVSNLPANIPFKVTIGKVGGVGTEVGTVISPKGGSVTATFNIPPEWQGKSKLDLRVEHQSFRLSTILTFENKNK